MVVTSMMMGQEIDAARTSIAEARPVGLSIAGVGGVASSKPSATAVVGPGGLAIARPVATAIAGVQINEAVLGGGDDGAASYHRPSHKHKPYHNKKVEASPVQVVVGGAPVSRRIGQVQALQPYPLQPYPLQQQIHQQVHLHPRLSMSPVGHASYAVLPGNVYYV